MFDKNVTKLLSKMYIFCIDKFIQTVINELLTH